MRRQVMVGYDISDAVRLRAVARTVEDFGDRIQFSVFVCEVGKRDLAVLKQRLLAIIKPSEDQVVLMDLGPVHDEDRGKLVADVLGRPVTLRNTRGMVF